MAILFQGLCWLLYLHQHGIHFVVECELRGTNRLLHENGARHIGTHCYDIVSCALLSGAVLFAKQGPSSAKTPSPKVLEAFPLHLVPCVSEGVLCGVANSCVHGS